MSVTDWFIRTQHAPFMWTMSSVHNDSIWMNWILFHYSVMLEEGAASVGTVKRQTRKGTGKPYTSILGGTWNIRTMFQAGKAATIAKKWNTTSLSPELGRNKLDSVGWGRKITVCSEGHSSMAYAPKRNNGLKSGKSCLCCTFTVLQFLYFFCLFMSFFRVTWSVNYICYVNCTVHCRWEGWYPFTPVWQANSKATGSCRFI